MATPPKQPRVELEMVMGYIHSVSPIRFSVKNASMFNAVLQTGREHYHDIMIFSRKKITPFRRAARSGTAVCLTNVRKDFRSPDDFDVVAGKLTKLSVITLPFTFRPPPATVPLMEVSAMLTGRKVATVEAKVVAISPSTRTIFFQGAVRELRVCCISDGSVHITLQLWETHIDSVQLLGSYCFTELSTRSYQGKVQLTTTFYTVINKITDLNVPLTTCTITQPELTWITGDIVALDIWANMKCYFCSAKQDNLDLRKQFHRCQFCRFTQKTVSYGKVLFATITFCANGEIFALTASNSALTSYLSRYNVAHEELEEHFVEQARLSVSFDNELRICEIDQTKQLIPDDLMATAATSSI